jgi:hypothetical protein
LEIHFIKRVDGRLSRRPYEWIEKRLRFEGNHLLSAWS